MTDLEEEFLAMGQGPQVCEFRFFERPFENSAVPCLVMDSPEGGDPYILATLRRIYRPDLLHELCALAGPRLVPEALTKRARYAFLIRDGEGNLVSSGYSSAESAVEEAVRRNVPGWVVRQRTETTVAAAQPDTAPSPSPVSGREERAA